MNCTFILESLLRYNYLPIQKMDRSELPPFLSTTDITPKLAKLLVSTKRRKNGSGWDSIEYQATRFNGVGRYFSIPHPLAYSLLCLNIHDNWANLSYCTQSSNSMVRPRQHPDGRCIIMDYEKSHRSAVKLSFGQRFVVQTDISNFFPSVYSHSVTWAVVGFSSAKANQRKSNWFNDLDKHIRGLKRNETQGIAIGPGSSNVIAELILAKIDIELNQLGFKFHRYIDDYTAYCESDEKAQRFIQVLSEKLKSYKLLLNLRKTSIKLLPFVDVASWVSELVLSLPKGEIDKYTAEHFLLKAQTLACHEPDGSVLKYAIKEILGRKLKSGVENAILPEILNLAFHQPILLPQLKSAFQRSATHTVFAFGPQLHLIAIENARLRRSDGLCWALFYLNLYKVPIEDTLADAILDSRDCISVLLLYLSGSPNHQAKVINFARSLNSTDLYELDQYWLLLYELFFESRIHNPYSSEEAFVVLKSNGVRFVLPPFRVASTVGTRIPVAFNGP